ncbi:MAG: adenosylhomocysteinase [Bacteroidales bacterium]|nr:adenosylhomocysteinase [Bacteroidales bacterium]
MTGSEIRNPGLWESGELKISWVRDHTPLLMGLDKEFKETKPFKGLKIALSVHLEAKTARLCEVLSDGGAEMYITGSNPLSTQDDVAAALVHEGLNVFAVHGATPEEYERGIRKVIEAGPNIIIDDGGDLVTMIHENYPQLIQNVIGGCEETTTGILRLRAMEKEGRLKFPMMLVNDADCKHLFDNRYGTGQSVWDGINRTTNLIVAGKDVVVAGYGWCGKGVAMRAKGLGARVIVTEVDPIKAMEAVMDGFRVMTMREAAPVGDIFVTVTGCEDVIIEEHFLLMKDGAICCNAGHFDCEVAVAKLKKMAVSSGPARQNIERYNLPNGRKIHILAEGRLVNLAAGDGHPAEIMDMSFAIQALSAKYLADNKAALRQAQGPDTVGEPVEPPCPGNMLHNVPEEIDREVARRKLADWGVTIDTLTERQKVYLFGE